ncbi:MAG: lysylphosphatidylglycerol synthase domain-containing protein, partial [Arenicellales bacterium]|nr:lysylphosphatidylglycerol synthase domain-containing protein [Arenicellales bacterium]
MVIIPLVLGMLLYPVLDVGIQQRLVLVVVILIFVCGIGILILYPGLSIFARWLSRFDSRSKLLLKAQSFVSQFSDSVKLSLNRETIFKTFFLTVGVRVCKYSSIILLFMGIANAGYPDLVGADPGSILVGLLASEAAASLPIPTFMSFGTYEAGGLAAFAMLGMPVATAGLALFTVHIITQAVDYTIGGLAFVLFLMVTRTNPATLAAVRHKATD